MPKTPLWKSISQTLKGELADQIYGPGDKLPTEKMLASRFGVNRHTVRQALAAMAKEGLVHARRGSGVFVSHVPTDYPIGRRVRFHQNLAAAGRVPAKVILALQTRLAGQRERIELQLPEQAKVHVYEGLSLADEQPIALFRSVFPAELFPDLTTALEQTKSVTAALNQAGITDYTRASTRLTAKQATATQALHLRIPEGAPVLRTIGVNVDPSGTPIEYGHSWFAGDRVTLTVSDMLVKD